MTHQNNSIKAKISFFYDKHQILNEPEKRQTIGIGDAISDKNYVCGMCYDIDNKVIDAHIAYNSTMKFGRHHNCKDSDYCSKIYNETKKTESTYIKNINMDKLVNLLHFNINDKFNSAKDRLFYFYKSNCCILNPHKNIKAKDSHSKGTYFSMNCKIKATPEYVLFIKETEKVMFYFNEDFDLTPFKDCLLLYVNKHGFLRVMLGISNKNIVDCIYSEHNVNQICNDCLIRSENYLNDIHYYIPTQYKTKHIINPEKSKYIQCIIEESSALIDYRCMLLIIGELRKYNISIDPKILNKITHLQFEVAKKIHDTSIIEKVVDNLYHLIYNFTFTYGLSKTDSYDFITDFFIYIMKKETNQDCNFNPVSSKTIHKYIETPVRYKIPNKSTIDYDLICEYYTNTFVPNIINFMNNARSITRENHLLRSNLFLEIRKSVRRIETNKPIKQFSEKFYCKYGKINPYNQLPNKVYRCRDTQKYLKFEKLKFCLLLHCSIDYKKETTHEYTYYTKDQIMFLSMNQSIFWTTHEYIDSIDESLLDKAYDIFNLNQDYDIIKNMRSNFKYPYYTINYHLNTRLRYIEDCSVKLYYKLKKTLTSHHFIQDYLKNKILTTNIY
jgi:hypothetical protein